MATACGATNDELLVVEEVGAGAGVVVVVDVVEVEVEVELEVDVVVVELDVELVVGGEDQVGVVGGAVGVEAGGWVEVNICCWLFWRFCC